MPTQLQVRGGTQAEGQAFTGAQRELYVDTDNNTINVHDGITAGGFPLATKKQLVDNTIYYNDDTGAGSAADIYILSAKTNTKVPNEYLDGVAFGFVTENANTGPATANFAGLGVKSLKYAGGLDPVAGDLLGRVNVIYDADNDWLEIQPTGDRVATIINEFVVPSITGLVVTNNPDDLEHDIDISAGQYGAEKLVSGLTKSLDTTFAAGNGNGGMVGVLPASGVIYIFLIKNGSDIDVYAETTNGENPPSGWTIVKRIAVRATDAAANLQRVIVTGEGEQLTVYPYSEVLDWSVSTVPLTRTAFPISGVLRCPPNVNAKIIQTLASGVTTGILMTSLDCDDTVPSSSLIDVFTSTSQTAHAQIQKDVYVNSNRQVGVRRINNDVNSSYAGRIISWVEDRS